MVDSVLSLQSPFKQSLQECITNKQPLWFHVKTIILNIYNTPLKWLLLIIGSISQIVETEKEVISIISTVCKRSQISNLVYLKALTYRNNIAFKIDSYSHFLCMVFHPFPAASIDSMLSRTFFVLISKCGSSGHEEPWLV